MFCNNFTNLPFSLLPVQLGHNATKSILYGFQLQKRRFLGPKKMKTKQEMILFFFYKEGFFLECG